MDSRWFKGHKDKDKRRQEVMSYRSAFDELRAMLSLKEPKMDDYESPSWAYKRADQDGFNRAIKEVLNLINITNKDNT